MGAGGRAALETQGPNRQERKAGPTQVDPHVTLGRKGLAIRAATEPCLGSQTLPHLLNPHICSATQTSPTRWWWLRQFPPKLHLGKRKEVRGAGPWQKLPPTITTLLLYPPPNPRLKWGQEQMCVPKSGLVTIQVPTLPPAPA